MEDNYILKMDYQAIKRVPDGHWNKFENHIDFRNYLAKKFNLETPDDWYQISTATIRTNGGNGLLNSKYKGQTLTFLKTVFPEVVWYPWLFEEPLKKFWKDDTSTHTLYIQWLAKKFGWISHHDYYKITLTVIKDNKGSGLLSYYNSSIIQLLSSLFHPPEGDDEWYPWKFDGSTPNNYWDSMLNQRKYANWLFKQLKFTKLEDWYSVTQDTFREYYGSGLILNSRTYNSSHIAFLQAVYEGEFTFYPWCFSQTPNGYWKILANRMEFMKWLGKIVGYVIADDWYQITRDIIRLNHGGGLMTHYYNDSMIRMIIELNPDLSFDESKFNTHKTESKLESYLRKHNIVFTKQYTICHGKKNGTFKIDFYLEPLRICIELDGPQHFRQVWCWTNPIIQKNRDVYKMIQMKEKGLRCIRLLQEDVLNNTESWMDIHLLPLLVISTIFEPTYIITEESQETIYDGHRQLYEKGDIVIDDMYE